MPNPTPQSQPGQAAAYRGRAAAEGGQAAAEFAALLPLIAVVLALCWQAVVGGHAVWSAHGAARAAARAAAVGGDPLAAARAAVPSSLDDAIAVRTPTPGEVTVRLPVPAILPGLHLGAVTAHAYFAPQT